MGPSTEISVQELKTRLDRGDRIVILDVREPGEFALSNIGGTLIPLGQLPARVGELTKDAEIAVLCHHGIRSRRAADFLLRSGFPRVLNITGGIQAWSEHVDPSVPTY
jgi:adenylyltransferase/sulfurtransferase